MAVLLLLTVIVVMASPKLVSGHWVGGGPSEYIEEMTFHLLSAPRSSSLRRGATLHGVMSGRWGRE